MMTDRRSIPGQALLAAALLSLLAAVGASAQTSLAINRFHMVRADGTPAANCQSLRGALAAITDATAANPYTLRLEPGEYGCGENTVTMKSHVDLEGSGEGVTRVYGTRDSDVFGVVDMADQSELRFLTVESLADPFKDGIAVSARSGESRIVHATLIAGEGDFSACGLSVDTGASVEVRDSTLEGFYEGVFVESGGTAVLAYSQLVNSYFGTGSLTCLFSYDGALAELNANCDPPT